MTTDIKRRIFLKGTLAASAVGIAAGAGLLVPTAVLAEWPKEAFGAKNNDDALKALFGSTEAADSSDIKIDAPPIAENSAQVRVTVESSIPDTQSITYVATHNVSPLVATYNVSKAGMAFVTTNIKMAKPKDSNIGEIIALVQAGGKLYKARQEIKITIGGCGG